MIILIFANKLLELIISSNQPYCFPFTRAVQDINRSCSDREKNDESFRKIIDFCFLGCFLQNSASNCESRLLSHQSLSCGCVKSRESSTECAPNFNHNSLRQLSKDLPKCTHSVGIKTNGNLVQAGLILIRIVRDELNLV